MSRLIPNRFLFDFEFPLRYRKSPPTYRRGLAGWDEQYLLPDFGAIDGQPAWASVWACWNDAGITIACKVSGKTKLPSCNPRAFWKGDNLRLCIDTRDTRDVKRATAYCQQFYLLPSGGGRSGRDPEAASAPINRARELAPAVLPGQIQIDSHVDKSGYELQATLPAECLNGFDPTEHPRIGFYYILEDQQHGQQYLTVGDDLYWFIDPSTWATAVLTR